MKSETEPDSIVCDDKDRAEFDAGFRVYKCVNPDARPADMNKVAQDRVRRKNLINSTDNQLEVTLDDSASKPRRSLKKTKKKQSAIDRYWELFACFCFADNQSGTYTELIDRVNFYNQTQTFTKKVPVSATPGNACLLRYARSLFFGIPKEIPSTQYDYLYFLVCRLSTFENWLQDNFKFYHLDSNIDYIISKLKHFMPSKFKKLNPEMNDIEEQGAIALGIAGFKGNLYQEAIGKLDTWRKSKPGNDEIFCKLHCMLGSDFTPIFNADDIKDKTTEDVIQVVFKSKEQGKYDFTWQGKDICKMRANTPEYGAFIPDKESSKDWDTTQNLYIEGDNLRALKLLAPAYSGKVKMIYIDPPYNTGHKFCYKDNFKQETEIFDRYLLSKIPMPPAKEI